MRNAYIALLLHSAHHSCAPLFTHCAGIKERKQFTSTSHARPRLSYLPRACTRIPHLLPISLYFAELRSLPAALCLFDLRLASQSVGLAFDSCLLLRFLTAHRVLRCNILRKGRQDSAPLTSPAARHLHTRGFFTRVSCSRASRKLQSTSRLLPGLSHAAPALCLPQCACARRHSFAHSLSLARAPIASIAHAAAALRLYRHTLRIYAQPHRKT